MPFNSRLFDSKSGIALQKLQNCVRFGDVGGNGDSDPSDETLSILVHNTFFGELQLVL